MAEKFSLRQRVFYQIKRHWLPAAIALLALVGLTFTESGEGVSLGVFFLMKIGKQAIGIGIPVLLFKFVFPKVSLQTELIEEHNIAIAILFAGAIVGANL